MLQVINCIIAGEEGKVEESLEHIQKAEELKSKKIEMTVRNTGDITNNNIHSILFIYTFGKS